ncbi:hypothetical protein GCM10011379_19700 [Filimonas zeae]|uniref:Thioredoxin domain-containing protein n=1 Tax=Filimonas zeae TaxID=1737353 RepID=A0A917IWT9_9BACT|nr:hypothetical protein GCM10011379_19700 [Filimonas zeae]
MLGVLAGVSIAVKAQQVSIQPQFPQRLQPVTITYTPAHPQQANAPVLVFTYSNFYGLPRQLPLQKKDSVWQVTFPVQHYATYATFFVKDGNDTIRAAHNRHFGIPVYRADRVQVKNGRLYESYSLTAQMGKSPRLSAFQRALLQLELKDYPDNFEAQVRLYANRMAVADEQEKGVLKKEAYAYIAKVFEQDPVKNVNLATMGYLILGDNRNDSVYTIIRERYPQSAMGTEMRISRIAKEKDTALKISLLEKEIAATTAENRSGLEEAHEMLFEYYTSQKQAEKALQHARQTFNPTSPYYPKQVMQVATTLAQSGLAPDSALQYALLARQLSHQYPAGLILYFKETGHIPAYVSDSARTAAHRQAEASALALAGMALVNKGDSTQALRYLDSALATAQEPAVLQFAATAYQRLHRYQQAWQCYRQQLLLQKVMDTAMVQLAKHSYTQWQGATGNFEQEWQHIQAQRRQQMRQQLQKQLLHAPAPSLADMVNLNNQPVLPDTLQGKVILIDFWATWCIPCMQEMPYLQKVYDQYKHRSDVCFMIVNSGSRNTLADAQNWFGNKKYSFPVYFHTNPGVADRFGFNTIPALFIIDKQGKLQYKHMGFEGPQVEEHLKELIDLLL